MGEFCSIRSAPLNRDLRDMVECVDLFPFFEPQRRLSACSHRQAKGAKERLYVRRVKRRTYIVSPQGQSLLCVPCGFVVYGKQRGILKIAGFSKVSINRGLRVPLLIRCEKTVPFNQSLQKTLPSLFEVGKMVRF
jgi:hypothetical protein